MSGNSTSLSKQETPSAVFSLQEIVQRFPLPWSAYVSLMSIKNGSARKFYEEEALRGGWSVRQLNLSYRFWRFPLPIGFGFTYSFDDENWQTSFSVGGRF